MFKRLIGLFVVMLIVLSQSIFSQYDEPVVNDNEAKPLKLPEVSASSNIVIKRDPFHQVLRDIGLSEDIYTLEKYDVSQYVLIGIMSGIASPKAMFRAPDGRKYILKKGDKIGRNGGIIMQIDKGQVVVLERVRSYTGSVNENTIVKTLKNAT